jgi:hypothetical protein
VKRQSEQDLALSLPQMDLANARYYRHKRVRVSCANYSDQLQEVATNAVGRAKPARAVYLHHHVNDALNFEKIRPAQLEIHSSRKRKGAGSGNRMIRTPPRSIQPSKPKSHMGSRVENTNARQAVTST